MKKSKIFNILPTLRDQDLQDIRNRIDFLLKGKNNNSQHEFFYDIITKHFQRLSGVPSPPYSVFKKGKYNSKLKEAFQFLNDIYYVTGIGDCKKKRVQFYMLFVKVLVLYIDKYGLPRSITTILNCYQKFPTQLESSFPEYMSANLIKNLFK